MRIHYSLEALKLENRVNSAEQAPLLKNVSFTHAAPALPTLAAPQRLRRADPDTLHSLNGTSMGTHWRVRVGNPQFLPLQTLRSAIEDVLASVVRHMSHWQADSTLAQFNRARTLPPTLPIGGPPARTPSLRHKRAAAGKACTTTRNAAGGNTAACSWI